MKKENRNRGFTLVELLITVAVLAVIVAPFLSLFVMASGNNLNASKKKDAADVAEDIAEEIKGKSIDVLKSEWSCTDSGNSYEFTIPESTMPAGVKRGFSAKAKLEANNNKYNDEMPQLASMKGEDTVLLMRGFYSNDNMADAVRRESSIIISKEYNSKEGKDVYVVSLKVVYYDNLGNALNDGMGADGKDVAEVTSVERDGIPSVYAIYTPMSVNDSIEFVNNLSDDEMRDGEGELIPIDFYLSIQNAAASIAPSDIRNHISINEIDGALSQNIYTYISNNLTNDDRYINIYTNVFDSDASLPRTADGTVEYKNTLVKSVKSERFYDLTVEVYYNDKGTYDGKNRCAVFKSSKLHLG